MPAASNLRRDSAVVSVTSATLVDGFIFEEANMFCVSCGRALAENLRFCDGCDARREPRSSRTGRCPHRSNYLLASTWITKIIVVAVW